MARSINAAVWVIATAAIAVGLVWFRDLLTQFAIALLLWLSIDGLRRFLSSVAPVAPRWLALIAALVCVVSLVVLVVWVTAANLSDLSMSAPAYERRLNEIAAQAHAALGLGGEPPTLGGLIAGAHPAQLLQRIADALQRVVSDAVFIFIFVGFIFAAAATFPAKLDAIFPDSGDRKHARQVFTSIRAAMERYLWVQTIASLIITGLTYVTLAWIGLDNAVFWAFLIFFLNYIPTIGSIIGTALPTLFALVQFPTLAPVAGVALGVGAWQFLIGNFVQPRLTGDSLNLSTIVVLLALGVWGTLWGIAGAFLAAPLTVMIMIVLAQFPSTRWIAILLSANAKPEVFERATTAAPVDTPGHDNRS